MFTDIPCIEPRELSPELKQLEPCPIDVTAANICECLKSIESLAIDLNKIIASYAQHQHQRLWRGYSVDQYSESKGSKVNRFHDFEPSSNVNPLPDSEPIKDYFEIDIVQGALCHAPARRGPDHPLTDNIGARAPNRWHHDWVSVQRIIETIRENYQFSADDSPNVVHAYGAIANLYTHLNELKKLIKNIHI